MLSALLGKFSFSGILIGGIIAAALGILGMVLFNYQSAVSANSELKNQQVILANEAATAKSEAAAQKAAADFAQQEAIRVRDQLNGLRLQEQASRNRVDALTHQLDALDLKRDRDDGTTALRTCLLHSYNRAFNLLLDGENPDIRNIDKSCRTQADKPQPHAAAKAGSGTR